MKDGVNILMTTFDNVWLVFASVLPEIIAALVVVIIGLIVSPILGKVAKKLVRLTKIDSLSEKTGMKEALEKTDVKMTFAGLIGGIVKWFFLIVFFMVAVDILGWTQITLFLYQIVLYIPNVIVAVLLIGIGLIVGGFVGDLISKGLKASQTPIKKPELLGKMAKFAIIVFAVLAAVLQLGIAQQLIIIFFAGVVFALALAFGLGGKAKAAKFLDKIDGTE